MRNNSNQESNFARSRQWGTLSKAFAKSSTTACTDLPLSSEFAKSWIVKISWDLVDLFALNPCWQSVRI